MLCDLGTAVRNPLWGKRRMKSQTVVVLTLGVTQTLAWGSTYYLPAILAVPMAGDLGVPTSWIYGAFSTALVVTAFLGPISGRWIDRHGGRGILAVSSVFFAAGLFVLASATGAGTMLAAWLIIGMGMAIGLYEAAFSALAGIYKAKARGAITGITLIAGFASTVCWPVSAYMEAEVGWRAACLYWACAHLLIGLPLNYLILPKWERQTEEIAGPMQIERKWNRSMALLALVFFITWFISTAMAVHLPRLLQQAGASLPAAIALAALVGPAQVAARIFEFGLPQKFHPLLSARLASIAHPAGAVALLMGGTPTAFLFVLLHGAGNGILTIAKGTLPLAIFGSAGYGSRQGLLMMPARLGQAAAPLIFGFFLDQYGLFALLFSSAMGVASFSALIFLSSSGGSKTK